MKVNRILYGLIVECWAVALFGVGCERNRSINTNGEENSNVEVLDKHIVAPPIAQSPGIISYDSFLMKAKSYVAVLASDYDFTCDTPLVVDFVRVQNTIGYHYQFLAQQESNEFDTYSKLFDTKLFMTGAIVKILDAKVTKGFGWYSKKYDVQLGGGGVVDFHSRYFIKEDPITDSTYSIERTVYERKTKFESNQNQNPESN